MSNSPASKPHSWAQKFKVALRGWKLGMRGHSSFFVHFFAATAVICAALVLQMSSRDWAILLLCIGAVLTAELFNSALETLFRGLDVEARSRSWPALDIAAGGVLMISLIAAVVGTIIFVARMVEIYG